MQLLTAFRFEVIFELLGQKFPIRASEVSGLSVSVETENIKEGGQNEYIQKLPTYPQYPNMIIKRAMDVDAHLYKWLANSITTFTFIPIPLTVLMLSENQEPILTWRVANAYPVKWEVSTLQADQSNLAIESLELAYQRFYLV